MKQSELPRCPECGNMPEYALKPNHMGWVPTLPRLLEKLLQQPAS